MVNLWFPHKMTLFEDESSVLSTLFKIQIDCFVDSGQFSLARNTLQHDEPGLLTIVREHETVPNGFGRLGTTV
jgi:hypothetical protein